MPCHRHQIWHGDTFKDITDAFFVLVWKPFIFSRRNVWLTSTYHFVYNNGIYAIRILLLWPAYLLLSGHWHMKIYSFFFINGNLLQNITPTHIRTDENSQYYNKSKAGKVFHTLNYMLHLLSSLICWMQRRRDKNLLFASLTQTRTHLHTTL